MKHVVEAEGFSDLETEEIRPFSDASFTGYSSELLLFGTNVHLSDIALR